MLSVFYVFKKWMILTPYDDLLWLSLGGFIHGKVLTREDDLDS